MSAPITGTEIVALPGWRWHPRLTSMLRGRAFVLRGISDADAVRQLAEMGAEPDPADPLLPGWLLHLLRERFGEYSRTCWHPGGWAAWVPADAALTGESWRLAGQGPTELHALVDALWRVS